MSSSGEGNSAGLPSDEDWATDKREFVLNEHERLVDKREAIADQRDAMADARERELDERDQAMDTVESPNSQTDRAAAERARDAAQISRGEARRLALAAVEVARAELASSGRVPPLLAEFAILAKHLQGSANLDECLDDIVHFTHRIASASDAASLSILKEKVLRTGAATSAMAREVDEMQASTHQGPSVQALQRGDPVTSGNVGDDHRWPEFGPLAQGVGVLSALAVCIHLDREPAQVLGTLNQYSADADAFDQADEEVAIVLAAHAAVAIASINTKEELNSVTLALRSRDVIGQAKGILMGRGRLTADQAFDALRKASQLLNRRLTEIAAEVAVKRDVPKK